jgi:hypothetical protein
MENKTQTTGVGILGVLQIVFIVLKLTGVITWSWWMVLMPLWINIGIIILFLVIVFLVVFIKELKS